MVEVWKPVKSYENYYEVSNLGNVKRLKKDKHLVPSKDLNGYFQVLLCKNGTRKCMKIHKLVANAFIENPNNYNVVNHKDEVKTNNFVENLEWCTIKYNVNYGTGLTRAAQKRMMPIYQMLNKEIIATYKSAVEASEITGINYSKIRMCCRNERKTAGGYEWANKKIKEIKNESN